MKTLIIIPAFNEALNIENLIKKIQLLPYDYLIINDCSTDNTSKILDERQLNHLDLPINMGLAGVTQMGFRYAVEHGYDSSIIIDGDGQHPPVYIEKLIDELHKGYDYVVGSRYLSEKKPWTSRMIGSRFICLAIQLTTGRKVTDPTSGMRALGKNVLESFAENMNFIAEPDALAYLLRNDYQVGEIQVSMDEREAGESYFSNPLLSIKFMTNVLLSILMIQVVKK